MIDQTLLRELVEYDRETGCVTWRNRDRVHFSADNQFKTWNRRYAGTQAGWLDSKGYRAMRVLGRTVKAHHVAWMYVYGCWPAQQIDHINFDTVSDAGAARAAAELEFGFHANHGAPPPTQKLESRPFPKRWEVRS